MSHDDETRQAYKHRPSDEGLWKLGHLFLDTDD